MFKLYKKLFNYAKEYLQFGILAVIFAFFSTVSNVIGYYYISKFIYALLLEENFSNLKLYSIRIVIFLTLSALLYAISGYMSHKLGFRLETNFRKKGIEGLSTASFSFFETNSSGVIRKTIDDNAGKTHMIIAHLIPDNSKAILTPLLIIILSFTLNIRVGITILVLSILSLILLFSMMGNMDFMKLYQESLDKMSSETVEYIRGIQVIKIFSCSVKNVKNLYKCITDYSNLAYKYSKSCEYPYCNYQFIFFALSNLLIVPIVFIFKDINSLKLLAADLMVIFFFSGVIFSALMSVMWVFSYVYEAKYAISNLEKLYDDMHKNSIKFGDKTDFDNYNIEFENVCFSYKDKLVLNNLSFNLEENKVYAFVGNSGGGKSTIAKLISGFYNLDSGTIRIGGVDITKYTENSIISNISFVFQDAKLFKKSIFENVLLANPNATKDQVMTALTMAGCDEILNRFEMRENTIIGSNGVYLSGGEKQRIAIARALLKNSKILIFDEASASIDAKNEYELQKAFKVLMKNKTVIMIAHRLSSIKNVDEILVIDNGKIIERGKHKKLLENGGKYATYWTKYLSANDWRVM